MLELPGPQLRGDGGFLLLGEILIEGQRIARLFLLAIPGTAVRPLGSLFGIRRGDRNRSRDGPGSVAVLSAPLRITTGESSAGLFVAPWSQTQFGPGVSQTDLHDILHIFHGIVGGYLFGTFMHFLGENLELRPREPVWEVPYSQRLRRLLVDAE